MAAPEQFHPQTVMFNKSIYVASHDYTRLRLLAAALTTHQSPSARTAAGRLLQELDRCILVAAHELPPGTVRLGSTVTIEDVESGETDVYTLSMPDQANPEQGRLSVLAPVGTAILGYAEGDEITWETPGGMRRLKLRQVSTPEMAATERE